MRKYSFFEQFYIAMAKYVKLKRLSEQGMWQHVKYVFGVTLLVLLIVYVVPVVSFFAGIGGYSGFFDDRMPAFSIENGSLQIEKNLDFVFNGIRVVIDDSMEGMDADKLKRQSGRFFIATKNNLATSLFGDNMIISYDQFASEKIDNKWMAAWESSVYTGVMMAGAILWLVLIICHPIIALVFAVFAMPIALAMDGKFKFGQVYKMAIYGITAFQIANGLSLYIYKGVYLIVVALVSSIYCMHGLNCCIGYHSLNKYPDEEDD